MSVPAVAAATPNASLVRRTRRRLTPLGFLFSPVGLLLLFFVAPMAIMLQVSFEHNSAYSFETGYTLDNYREILTNPLYRDVGARHAGDRDGGHGDPVRHRRATGLRHGVRAGRFELPLLLALVLADELNPIVRIYAWRELLGREGLINDALQWLG